MISSEHLVKKSGPVIELYQRFCHRVSRVAINFGVKNANLFTTKGLSTCRIAPKEVLIIVDFIEMSIRWRQSETNLKLIHPKINRQPLYDYNKLQWSLREFIGTQRIRLLIGVTRKSTILKNLMDLAVSPKEIKWILELVNKKGIHASTSGFDAPVIKWYFEKLTGHLESHRTSQIEISFMDLRGYKMAIGEMPNYFDLSASKISSIREICGITKALLKRRIKHKEFNEREVRALVELIRLL